MLKYFLRQTFILTLIGFVFRTYFLYYFSDHTFSMVDAWFWGIRFDIAIAVVGGLMSTLVACTIYYPEKPYVSKAIAAGFALLLLLMLIGDALFFIDSGRHVSYEAKSFFTSFAELTSTGTRDAPMSFIGLLIFIPMTTWFLTSPLYMERSMWLWSFELVVILAITFMGFRGFSAVPQNPSFAYKMGDARKAIVAMNGAFGFLHGLFSSKVIHRTPITIPDDVIGDKVVADYLAATARSIRDETKKANIVFILLEGWPARALKSYGADTNVAPFFDYLRRRSLTTEVTFAGGLRTTEGIFATFCGWQNPLGLSVAKSQLEAKPYRCLPHILREKKWSSAFFQGTTKETSGTGELAQVVGFEESYGKHDVPGYKQLPHNNWGLFDRDVYNFALSQMSEMTEPFVVGINTNTTHSMEFPPYDSTPHNCLDPESCYMAVLSSADRDLQIFFRKYEEKHFRLPTIFVLIADHSSKSDQGSRINGFRIPMLIHSPYFLDNKFNGIAAPASTQRDVAITVAHILGLDTGEMLGRSLLDKSAPTRAEYFHQGIIGWVIDSRLYEISIESGKAIGCYDWRKDPGQTMNLLQSIRFDPDCQKNLETARREALFITDWAQDKLFKGTTTQRSK